MAATLPPIGDDAQLTGRVHAALRDAIVNGHLSANARLVQEQIAAEMKVSRTPVREALHLLEREGLVELIPRRGAIVHALTDDDVRDLYELRTVLEPFAAERAACCATAAQRRELSRLAASTAGSRGPEGAFALNRAFHEALCAPCGNAMIMRTLTGIWAQHGSYRLFAYQAMPGGALDRMAAEHVAIAEAFAAGDVDSVRRAVHAHITAAGDDVLARLAGERSETKEGTETPCAESAASS